MDAVLTLQIPKGSRFVPIAMTGDRRALLFFKQVVLAEWEMRHLSATDEIEAACQLAEYDKLVKVLDLLIPDEVATNDH